MPPIDPFLEALETALDHLADPAWLGAQSPLASTYVLGVAAAGDPAPAAVPCANGWPKRRRR